MLQLLRNLEDELGPAVEIQCNPQRPGDVGHSCLCVDSIREELGWEPRYDLAGGIANMLRTNEET